MPNQFFKFRQFIVHQDKCAMKVCTDACLFGSIVANTIHQSPFIIRNCLDIGTGTGLLSLMVVQKNNLVKIDAVEIDEMAAQQTQNNFQLSPWKAQLQIVCADVKNFSSRQRYDFIFSNPPFFEDDLKSNQASRNIALHSTDLNLKELIEVIKNNLAANGTFAVLLPYHRTTYFEDLCMENNFYCNEKVLVRQTPKHHFFRSILFFAQQKNSFIQNEITIQIKANEYSNEFKGFLRDYYLNVDKA